MISPLIILVACAVTTGAFGSLFVLLAIAVDTWTEINFDTSKFSEYTGNGSQTIQVTLPAMTKSFVTVKEKTDDVWITYYLFDQYGGAWRLCDELSEKSVITGVLELLFITFSFWGCASIRLRFIKTWKPPLLVGIVLLSCKWIIYPRWKIKALLTIMYSKFLNYILYVLSSWKYRKEKFLEHMKGKEIPDAARSELSRLNYTKKQCYNFVSEYDEESSSLSENGKSVARLQNSAASCFIVCIIDLVAAAGVGVIALTQKQVAACMVTGVLYLMAGVFTVFGLVIFHVKSYYENAECYALETLPSIGCTARTVSVLWACPLAWVGVLVCLFAGVLWLFLTRALGVIKAKTML